MQQNQITRDTFNYEGYFIENNYIKFVELQNL